MPATLEARSLCKSYPGVKALRDVSLRVDPGEILAVVGENGAGKSTLMRILAGIESPDSGELLIDGRVERLADVRAGLARGIVLIHQELNLAEPLSVVANLFLGREPRRAGLFLDRAAMDRAGRSLLDRVGLNVSLGQRVADLSIGQRQLVEIARALGRDARAVIMDEPTSSLSPGEAERLFSVIRELRSAGVAIIYISHRLAEVRAIADRVTVLRDGANAGELSREAIHHDALVRLMVGRDLKTGQRPDTLPRVGPPRLELRDVMIAGGPMTPVSLAVYPGEVVGLGGLVGAGRTELAEAMCGLRRITSGRVFVDGRPVTITRPADAIAHSILLVPEDRRDHGLHLGDSIQDNLALPNLDRWSRFRIIDRGKVATVARQLIESLGIKSRSARQPVALLSGGNQQKVVFGKWLARGPRVFVLDEPTRGVDVGAREEITALIRRLADDGVAVLLISSDMEELLALSDRIVVMHEGRVTGELRPPFTEEAVMRLATAAQPSG